MKKILFIGALAALFALDTQAQSVKLIASGGSFTNGSNPYYTALDTIDNSETVTHSVQVPNRWTSVTFQVNMIDISGDPSGVTVNIYSSIDGTNYDSTPLFTDTMANANTVVVHEIVGNPATHYKIVVTGTGTHSSSYRSYVLIR